MTGFSMTLRAHDWQFWAMIAWPVLTAVASVGAHKLDSTTRGHKVLVLLAKLGIDLPGIWDALRGIVRKGAK
jgi:hypothetical protein